MSEIMSTLTINQIIKLVEKLGGPKEVRKILSGKIIITKDYYIIFSHFYNLFKI